MAPSQAGDRAQTAVHCKACETPSSSPPARNLSIYAYRCNGVQRGGLHARRHLAPRRERPAPPVAWSRAGRRWTYGDNTGQGSPWHSRDRHLGPSLLLRPRTGACTRKDVRVAVIGHLLDRLEARELVRGASRSTSSTFCIACWPGGSFANCRRSSRSGTGPRQIGQGPAHGWGQIRSSKKECSKKKRSGPPPPSRSPRLFTSRIRLHAGRPVVRSATLRRSPGLGTR